MSLQKASKIVALIVASLVFAASLSYLVGRFQWRQAYHSLLEADFVRLIVLISIGHFAYILVRAWRWRCAVQYANPHVSFFDFYWISAVVVSLSILTPGQIGEVLKIELMKRRGLLGRLPGLGAFALERILDLLVITGMGAVSLLFGTFAARYPGLKTGAAFLIVFGLIGLYVLLRFDPGGRTSPWLARMRSSSGSPTTWAMMAALTVCSWSLVGVCWQVALSAVHIRLSFPQILSLLSLVTIGTLVSFVPGGLGVSEVLTSTALINMGIATVTGQAGALILRAYGLIVVLFGLLHLIFLPLSRLPARRSLRD
jgi:uncharacterized membrane protein YbhN (UPF0104 family)